jgi:hypothetical protein
MVETDRKNENVRPNISTIENNAETTVEEQFQNNVLRPIIKMQHALLIAHFRAYVSQKKFNYAALPVNKQIEFIENFVQSDLGFRSELRGLVIGQFTVSEYNEYITKKGEINKRIINIIQQRILSNLAELNTLKV